MSVLNSTFSIYVIISKSKVYKQLTLSSWEMPKTICIMPTRARQRSILRVTVMKKLLIRTTLKECVKPSSECYYFESKVQVTYLLPWPNNKAMPKENLCHSKEPKSLAIALACGLCAQAFSSSQVKGHGHGAGKNSNSTYMCLCFTTFFYLCHLLHSLNVPMCAFKLEHSQCVIITAHRDVSVV